MNSQRETYSSFEEFWENANRRLTDFNEKQARMIWQAATEQGVGYAAGYVSSDNTIAVVDGNLNLPAGTVLYTHPPKPTGGGVPVPISLLNKLAVPIDGHGVEELFARPRSEAINDLQALLATQQPPEQE